MIARFIEDENGQLGVAFVPDTPDERLLAKVWSKQMAPHNALRVSGWKLSNERGEYGISELRAFIAIGECFAPHLDEGHRESLRRSARLYAQGACRPQGIGTVADVVTLVAEAYERAYLDALEARDRVPAKAKS